MKIEIKKGDNIVVTRKSYITIGKENPKSFIWEVSSIEDTTSNIKNVTFKGKQATYRWHGYEIIYNGHNMYKISVL